MQCILNIDRRYMALKKLIEKEVVEKGVEDLEKAREKFIKGGGMVAADVKKPESKDEWTRIVIRIKKEAVMQIDELIGDTMGLTRTGWILQAIEEKLKK